VFESINEQSGWKFFIADDLRSAQQQDQIQHWLEFISRHETQLQALTTNGVTIILDLFVNTLESASVGPSELLMLGRCGIEIEWTFIC
jgi:hypothetical protein